jgi:type I restriction-modification system DNA methylase subunit
MPNDATFESFEKELNRLVESFGKRIADLKGPDYNEQKLREDFLNPFFAALGWDMTNNKGFIQREREVEIESATQIGGGRKRADYLFRTDKRERFVCEAKKPAEELHARYAFQAKRYAWNKGVPVAVLTDFEELKIFIVGGKPYIDEPHAGEWKSWHFRQYPLIARELWDLLARDKIAAGSIDAALDALPKKTTGTGKGRQQWLIKPDRTRALDNDFLEFLDETRRDLASDIYRNNDHDELLEGNKLTESVQRIIDRILFLRICEDRDIDTGTTLQSIVETWRKRTGDDDTGRRAHQQPFDSLREEPPANYGGDGIRAPKDSLWRAVVRHFRALDRRPPTHVPFFNGNLFKPHFTETLVIGDEWLAGFIGELSDDETPYLFNYIDVEILGSVYERFLGKVVVLKGRGISIDEKPEVRKAGGVYYTPRYVVDYIVEQTAGKLLDEIAAEKETKGVKAFATRTEKLRLLDPACGSGSFLIRAFERVCEHWQKRLTANLREVLECASPLALSTATAGEKRQRAAAVQDAGALSATQKTARTAWQKKYRAICWLNETTGDIHLTVALKRRILTQNIYGVDLDAAAVEVTQLSLYLKMLEHENRTTLQRQRELLADETEIALLPPLQDNIKCGNSLIASDFSMMPEDLVRVHAFDWPVQFAPIMKAGGFDAVIGNPPWGADLEVLVRKYLSEKFARVVERMVDSYIYFTDQALRLIRKEGRVGLVIPATVLNQVDAAPLRRLLLESGVGAVINAGKDIFTKKVLNTTALIATAGGKQPTKMIVGDLSTLPLEERGNALAKVGLVNSAEWIEQVNADAAYTFFANSDARTALLLRLKKAHSTLGKFTKAGIARGVSPDIAEAHVVADRAPELKKIEKAALQRSISGKKIKRYGDIVPDQWLIYTHKGLTPKNIPNAIARLEEFRNQNTCVEVKEGKHPWWALHRARDPEIFESPKLIGLTTTKTIDIVYDEDDNLVVTDAMYVFKLKPQVNVKAALGILHSKLFLFLYRISNQGEARVIPQIKAAKLEPLPFPNLATTDKSRHDKLVMLVDKLLVLMPKLRAAMLDTEKAVLQNAVTATDQQIDALVYELYGLTADEIKLVEGGQ